MPVDPGATGRPTVLLDSPRRLDRQLLPGVMPLTKPCDQALDDRDDRDRVVNRALGVGHAELERAEVRMEAELPPPRPGVGKRAARSAPAKDLGVGCPTFDCRGHALAREQLPELRAYRRQTRVLSLIEGGVRRHGREERQV